MIYNEQEGVEANNDLDNYLAETSELGGLSDDELNSMLTDNSNYGVKAFGKDYDLKQKQYSTAKEEVNKRKYRKLLENNANREAMNKQFADSNIGKAYILGNKDYGPRVEDYNIASKVDNTDYINSLFNTLK